MEQHLSAMKVTTDGCLFGAWVSHLLQKGKETFSAALDIGTGTGLLSLMVAQKSAIDIDAVEIDNGAAEQARLNFAQSPWAQRLQLIEGDINTVVLKKEYDAIFSNPPFYEKELASPNAARNMAHHSEQLTLEQLFSVIYQKLTAEGTYFLLLPYKRKKEIERLLNNAGLYIHTIVEVQPLVAHAPFRLLLKGGKKETEQKEIKTFCIKDTEGHYTPPFVQLLQDYYLYL